MFRVLTSFEVSVWKGIILFPLVAVGFNTNKFFSYKVNTWKNQHGQGFEFYLKLFGFYVEVDLSLDYEAN